MFAKLKKKLIYKWAREITPGFDPKIDTLTDDERNNWLRRFYLESEGKGPDDRPKKFAEFVSSYDALNNPHAEFFEGTDDKPANLILSGDIEELERDPERAWEKVFNLNTKHKPTIDIDVPCTLYPSRQPGHYHLMIDKSMTWADYKELMFTMARVGIIEGGYYAASVNRGASAIRLPPEELVTEKMQKWALAQDIFDHHSTPVG